jgi:flagellar biosynthetic protein FliR
MTILLHPIHGPATLALSSSLGYWQWAQVALGEVVIGLLLGLVANFVFEAALMAGQILGVQIGYSLANVFDPQTQADTPVLSEFHQLAVLLIFLQLDVHHWLLRSLVRSFAYLPPGAAWATLAAATGLLHAAGGIFLTGVQIAAPSLVATLVADMALGFMGKASPQLPVLFIGLAVKNLVGLTVLLAAMAYWPRVFNQQFAQAIQTAERLLHLAR